MELWLFKVLCVACIQWWAEFWQGLTPYSVTLCRQGALNPWTYLLGGFSMRAPGVLWKQSHWTKCAHTLCSRTWDIAEALDTKLSIRNCPLGDCGAEKHSGGNLDKTRQKKANKQTNKPKNNCKREKKPRGTSQKIMDKVLQRSGRHNLYHIWFLLPSLNRGLENEESVMKW